jgi:g-D-glutamyl-meso-diaminopimelate peptidase
VQPKKNPSGGGHTDWFIQTFGRPGFTIEIGRSSGETNLPLSAYPGVWRENRAVGLYLAKEAYAQWLKRQPKDVYNRSVTTIADTPVYKRPGETTQKLFTAPEGTVYQAVHLKGDWMGIWTEGQLLWIEAKHALDHQLQPAEDVVAIDQPQQVYRSPDENNIAAMTVKPGSYTADLRYGDWFRIMTIKGRLWILLAEE